MTALISPTTLSHGTIECSDTLMSRRFYQEFLGLGSVRPLPEAQYLWSGGNWSLVCVCIGTEPRRQGPENRFGLRVASASDVDDAYAAALRERERYGIREIRAVTEANGQRSFVLYDLDGNWWEIYHRAAERYDDLFARGDVAG
jgi:catechol 2,3-dioxygenase-like lactoylglutathione lyase family enzyme